MYAGNAYMHLDCIVVGGGISGLSAAEAVARRGGRVLLLEAGAAVGGALRSERTADGFLLEHGPNTVTSGEPELWRHFAELGIAGERLTAARSGAKRYVLHGGRLLPIPMSPAAFLRSPLLSAAGKLRLLAEPLLPRGGASDESVATFFARRLGPEPFQRLVDPFVSGVYAGDPQALSARAAFPRIWAAEQRAGSIVLGMIAGAGARRKPRQPGEPRPRRALFSFRDGLATWPRAIAAFLGPERLWTEARAVDLRPADGEWHVTVSRGGTTSHLLADRVVLATPAGTAAGLIERLAPAAAAALLGIPYPPVSIVHLGYRRADLAHPIDGFGMLCPSGEGRRVLGTLWPSALFPGRAPDGMVLTSSFVGGARMPELATQDDAALVATAHAEQRALIGASDKPVLARVSRWPTAIPQYNAGHEARVATLARLEAERPGLRLLGNYRDGVSVEACWRAGREAGLELAERAAAVISP